MDQERRPDMLMPRPIVTVFILQLDRALRMSHDPVNQSEENKWKANLAKHAALARYRDLIALGEEESAKLIVRRYSMTR